MAHELAVWLFAEQVGTLSLVDGRLSFTYHPSWLANPDAVALSCSLPLQAAPFDDIRTRPFFAGLLPEGHLRRLIAQRFQVSRQNDFALLDAIGGECAGAITLLPKDAVPQLAGAGEVSWLDDQRLSAILDELPRRPMLAGQDGLRLSLAGAQDKLPVVFDGQRIGLPVGGQRRFLLVAHSCMSWRTGRSGRFWPGARCWLRWLMGCGGIRWGRGKRHKPFSRRSRGAGKSAWFMRLPCLPSLKRGVMHHSGVRWCETSLGTA